MITYPAVYKGISSTNWNFYYVVVYDLLITASKLISCHSDPRMLKL
jgi:hypothetical protein